MHYNTILLRYGEIFLKGKNRIIFEQKLISNIKKITGTEKVKKLRSRMLSDFFSEHHKLKNVFGLISYSPALKSEKNEQEIKEKALKVLVDMNIKTFRINTKRSDKSFPIKSPEMNTVVGEFIEKNSDLEFSFGNPDCLLTIEINQIGAFLFYETINGFGGLPAGVEGAVLLLLEDDASLLAGLQFMKRGCDIRPFSLGKLFDIDLLHKFSPKKLQLKIVKEIDDVNGEILVVGNNFDTLKKYKTKKIIMRPLIAYDNEKIKKYLKKFKSS